MPVWIKYAIAFAILAVLAPFVARFARGAGRRARGGLMMASVLLGFGEVLDPPSKHIIEAKEEAKGSPENDEPV